MTRIADVVELTFGFAFKSAEFSDGPDDVRLLRGDNIAQGNLRWSGAKRFPVDRVNEVDRCLLSPGDVVIAMDRPWIGAGLKYAVVRKHDLPSLLVQRVARLRAKSDSLDQGFLGVVIGSAAFTNYVIGVQTGSAVPHISGGQIGDFEFTLPPIREQRAIAATLGALDDKIESNRRQRQLLRELGLAQYQASVRDDRRSLQLSAATVSIARGVAPKYADEDLDAALVINQKCIRDGWVSLALARRMFDRSVKTEKRASSGDILVNSTGTGTLGRVARWHAGDIYVDGHVSVVKADHSVTSPTVLAYSLLGRESDIEGLATGSTGQTELSAALLGELRVILPPAEQVSKLESTLITIEDRCDQLAAENMHLESTRDALLPELLSGRIRVPVEGVAA